MHKRLFLTSVVIFLFLLCFYSNVLASPEIGIWNATTTGLGDVFNGQFAILDPEYDGGNIGDELRVSDNYSGSYPGSGHYWFVNDFIRDTLSFSENFVDNGDGTGSRVFHTTRSNGTLYIQGENLWGHDAGSIYSAIIQEEAIGNNIFIWDSNINGGAGGWTWSHFEGEVHWWGYFMEDPLLISISAHFLSNYRGWNNDLGVTVMSGILQNVEMEIEPVPEPATMLLLSSGLLGLVGFRKRFKRS